MFWENVKMHPNKQISCPTPPKKHFPHAKGYVAMTFPFLEQTNPLVAEKRGYDEVPALEEMVHTAGHSK